MLLSGQEPKFRILGFPDHFVLRVWFLVRANAAQGWEASGNKALRKTAPSSLSECRRRGGRACFPPHPFGIYELLGINLQKLTSVPVWRYTIAVFSCP